MCELTGHYDVVYSPDDGGWYAQLWWNEEISPIYSKQRDAIAWGQENGGRYLHVRS